MMERVGVAAISAPVEGPVRTSFLLKEVRRFFRSSPLLSVSGVLVLSLSLAVCLLALTMIAALSSMAYPGMRSLAYATVAEQTDGGGSMPISWDTLESIHNRDPKPFVWHKTADQILDSVATLCKSTLVSAHCSGCS
jgi:hypothetical protein